MKALLLGDVCATKTTGDGFFKKDIDTLFGNTVELFRNTDLNMVNLECALTERDCEIPKIGPALKSPLQTAEVLSALGVHCCNLSNNHSFDFGIAGIRDTFEALKKSNVLYTGFGENEEDARRNFVFEKDGERISIVAVCEKEYTYALRDRMGARAYDEYDTMEDIRLAKESSDHVIVIYHGGKEHCEFPSPRLRKLCHAMIKNGADLILCQHSHCIGCYEEFNGGHILYGQGNFHFIYENIPSESSFEMWNTSLAAHYDTKKNTITFTPVVVNDMQNGIRQANEEEAKAILSAFQKRSEMLKTDAWEDGWREFCKKVGPSYYKRVIREFETDRDIEVFAHFLDCQAHTDVWREIFPTQNQFNEKN